MNTEHTVLLGMGCFWGAERLWWQTPGVISTEVGYAGGILENPSYEQVCTGATGHAEVVRVVFDPAQLPAEQLFSQFFEAHDPTQGMRQGNDVGSQYRSAIFAEASLLPVAQAVQGRYQARLSAAGLGEITTELGPLPPFWPAEGYHQRYLEKNPNGYCGLAGTGVRCG